ncbi:MAG: peptidylprolyl isomerase [Candidatus Poseidoniaceae archaeon]|nr:peptidylprolyl isomerase [Candidatus Poseidoniaceae archaeon]
MSELIVGKNVVASVHYTGTMPESGEVFDSSEGRDPLTFLVGHGQMIPGFEEEIQGAKIGEKRTFTLTPDKAYGERQDEAMMKIPREEFSALEEESKLEIGMTLVAQMQHGPAPFTVTELTDDEVTADFNHKLAGESLKFAVEIIELRDADAEELSHGHVHGPNGHHH